MSLFEDNFFDFVYIDANHEFPFIFEDINNWYPKVKGGGLLGGHDFYHGYDVVRAVMEFSFKRHLHLYVSHKDWWVIKK